MPRLRLVAASPDLAAIISLVLVRLGFATASAVRAGGGAGGGAGAITGGAGGGGGGGGGGAALGVDTLGVENKHIVIPLHISHPAFIDGF